MQTYTATLMGRERIGSGEMVTREMVDGRPEETLRRYYLDPDSGAEFVQIYRMVGDSNAPDIYEYALDYDGPAISAAE